MMQQNHILIQFQFPLAGLSAVHIWSLVQCSIDVHYKWLDVM